MKTLELRKSIFEHLPVICTALILLGIAAPILLYYQQASKLPATGPPEASHFRRSTSGHEIRGFRYEGSFNGKRSISIEADRLRIQKKKLGYFRFGLLKEARFDNARVHIYGHTYNKTANAGAQEEDLRTTTGAKNRLTFKGLFSKESLLSLPVKRISSIIMRPVSMTFHDDFGEISRIKAASAAIRLLKKDILFSGNVRVYSVPRSGSRSGPRILTADRLKILPDRAILVTVGSYTLQMPAKRLQGRNLTTDIYLNPVASENRARGIAGREGRR